ncbi:MAG: ribosome-associated translation inhibitor RaiA [Chloroflexota bacterium]|nr:ribosome-associated translation inhibitor RaiA [Chloroflexota bacterium]MDQ5867210.1 ribosome-associated translation inhibitor RaiA [Chloroflexota bacterium]
MSVNIRSKNFKLEPHHEEHIRKHVGRLDRHVEDLESTEVVLSQQTTRLNAQRFQYVSQVTLHTRHNIIRSEVAHDELLTSVDQALAHIEKQLERRKTRQTRRKKGAQGLGRSAATLNVSTEEPSVIEMAAPARPASETYGGNGKGGGKDDDEGAIVRVKRFRIQSMDPEEAIEHMELLGHNFYVFWNSNQERVGVVYRRNDGDYGLIEPELG